MPGFSKLHTSVTRECTAGCTGQHLCSYGGNAPVPREPEPISESVLFLQSPDLLPDFNLQADPLLFMTLVDEKTLGPPCVLCKSRVIASRHQTVYPEILRLDITTVYMANLFSACGPMICITSTGSRTSVCASCATLAPTTGFLW